MIFALFLIFASSERLQQCTPKKYIIEATNTNYNQFFGKSKPLYIRYYKKGCVYTPASQAYWDEASRLLPNVQFVIAECETKAIKFCEYVKGIQKFDVYPTFRIYQPNSTTHAATFGDSNSIHSASTYFLSVATDNAGYIPFNNPLIENLIPQSTNKIRIQPSKTYEFTKATLKFPAQATNFKSIFVQDYYYVVIQASPELLSKIRLVNVKQARFEVIGEGAVSGISTDVIGNESVDWSSTLNNQVSFERLNFRTDTTAKLDNCQSSNAYVYDANPVISGLKITNNFEIVRSNPTLVNCQVTGSVVVNMADSKVLPSIQLVGDNSVFNPTSIEVKCQAEIPDLSLLLISGSNIASLASKVTIENGENYKVVASKDQKALYIVNSSFVENDAPEVAQSTSDFLIKQYITHSQIFDLNSPPPGFNYTDSILFPLDKPSNSPTPVPQQSPVQTPTQQPPTQQPPTQQPPTQQPTKQPPTDQKPTDAPVQTPIEVVELRPPEVTSTSVQIDDITESKTSDTLVINTSKIVSSGDDSVRYKADLDPSTKNVIVSSKPNIDFQLNVGYSESETHISLDNDNSNIRINGDKGANLQLENSENINISGKGTFKLNNANEDSLTINKFIPSEDSTLSTKKELTVNEMEIYGKIKVDGDSANKGAKYKVKNLKLQQGATFESANLKLETVEVGVGSSFGYYGSEFEDTKFIVYYNSQAAVKQYPLTVNELDDIKYVPESITVIQKDIGEFLSQDRVIILSKDFSNQDGVDKQKLEETCRKWVKSFTSSDSSFNSLSYEISYNEDEGRVTLFATYKKVDDSNSGSGNKNGSSVGLIVGVIVAILVIGAAVAVAVIIKRKKTYQASTDDDGANLPPDNVENDKKKQDNENKNPNELNINADELELEL